MPDRTKELRLHDGRTLGYAEFGDGGGRPVVLVHGAPGYGLYWQALPDFPFMPGLRLIAPDRPGYGRSDFKPSIGYTEWPDDVASLADALALGRFSMLGVSGGGPCVLACAWKMPQRLDQVALISPAGPPVPEILAAISRPNRLAYRVARVMPWAMRLNMKVLAFLQRRDLDRVIDRTSRKLSAPDRAALRRPAVRRALRAAMSSDAVTRRAEGYAQDVINQARPWGFPLSDISTPVHVWQPEDDTSVPPVVGRYLERTLPDCTLHAVPDAGHLWQLENTATVLRELLEPTAARGGTPDTSAREGVPSGAGGVGTASS